MGEFHEAKRLASALLIDNCMKKSQLTLVYLFSSFIFLSSCSKQAEEYLNYQLQENARLVVSRALDQSKALIASLEIVSAAGTAGSGSDETSYSLQTALEEMDPSLLSLFQKNIDKLLRSPDISEAQRQQILSKLKPFLPNSGNTAYRRLYGSNLDLEGSLWSTLIALFEQNETNTQINIFNLNSAREALVELTSILTQILEQLKPLAQCFAKAYELGQDALSQCNQTCTRRSGRGATCFLSQQNIEIPGCPGFMAPQAQCRLVRFFPGHFGSCPGQEKPDPNDPDTDCQKWDDVEMCLKDGIRCPDGKEPRRVYIEPPLFVSCQEDNHPSSRQVGMYVCINPQAPDPEIPYPKIGERYPTYPNF
jgi:hypothetical protein